MKVNLFSFAKQLFKKTMTCFFSSPLLSSQVLMTFEYFYLVFFLASRLFQKAPFHFQSTINGVRAESFSMETLKFKTFKPQNGVKCGICQQYRENQSYWTSHLFSSGKNDVKTAIYNIFDAVHCLCTTTNRHRHAP